MRSVSKVRHTGILSSSELRCIGKRLSGKEKGAENMEGKRLTMLDLLVETHIGAGAAGAGQPEATTGH